MERRRNEDDVDVAEQAIARDPAVASPANATAAQPVHDAQVLAHEGCNLVVESRTRRARDEGENETAQVLGQVLQLLTCVASLGEASLHSPHSQPLPTDEQWKSTLARKNC
jgi:hypothetical protein